MNLLPILLQTKYQFLAQPETKSIWIFAVVIGVFTAILIIGGVLGSRRARSLDPDHRRKYSGYVFRKMAKDVGLQKHHIEILDYLIRVCKVKQPFLIFSNAGLLDDILKKGIYSLEQNRNIEEEELEKRLSHIFQIRQLIERNSRRGIGIKSTNFLKSGQLMVMTSDTGEQYQTKVVSNMRDMLACLAPKNKAGQDFRWNKGTRLKVHFWRDSDAGYAFQTKVFGYDTMKGVLSVLIQHSKTLRREQQRKFRRRPLHRPAFLYPIEIQQQGLGRRAGRKAVVQYKQRSLGNVLDVSAGGCSISGLTPLNTGSLLKMEFEIGRRERVTVFGKVKRVRSQKTRGGTMHIMFTKLSSSHLNRIYSYVYNYTA